MAHTYLFTLEPIKLGLDAVEIVLRAEELFVITIEDDEGGWPIHEISANTSGAPFMQSHRMSGHSGEARTVFLPDSHPPATLHP